MTDQTPVQPRAEVLGGLTPYLQVDGAFKAAEFYRKAFGAEQVFAYPADEKGRTMHIHLHINGSTLMLGDAYPEHGHPHQNPQGYTLQLHLGSDEIDTWWKRAIDAGCEEGVAASGDVLGRSLGPAERPVRRRLGDERAGEVDFLASRRRLPGLTRSPRRVVSPPTRRSFSAKENPMSYVDGFVLAVPKAKLDDYKKLANLTGPIWMEHGALAYVECIGDDVPYGELTSFPRAVQAKDDEIVVFAWVVYGSRQSRDAVMPKVMADPRLTPDWGPMPFDMKRMIFGGFQPFMEL